MILPSQFRALLAASKEPATVYLGCYPGTKFVSVYPCERWEELSEAWKDEKRFPNTYAMLNWQRLFFANVEKVGVDRAGRGTIPSHYRDRAGLKDEVAVIGVLDKMEIWNPAELEAFELEAGADWASPAGTPEAAAGAQANPVAAFMLPPF